MIINSQESANEILSKYLPEIADALDRAVGEANAQAKPYNTKRTLAELIRDAAVNNLKLKFENIKGVKILEKDNTILFRFGDSIIARVKKLDNNFRAKYNLTNSSRNFTSQNFELFGEQAQLTSVHIGYVLDDFSIGIKNMAIVCPINNGRGYRWILPLDEITVSTGNLNLPIEVKENNDNKDERLRIKPDIQKGKSQNGRTGEGSA